MFNRNDVYEALKPELFALVTKNAKGLYRHFIDGFPLGAGMLGNSVDPKPFTGKVVIVNDEAIVIEPKKNHFYILEKSMQEHDNVQRLISTSYSALAYSLFDFVNRRGELPSEVEILRIFQNTNDFLEAGSEINKLFIKLTKEALLRYLEPENKQKVLNLLVFCEQLHEDPCKDYLVIHYADRTFNDPEIAVLDELFHEIRNYEEVFLRKNIEKRLSLKVQGTMPLIDELKQFENLNSFIYQSTVEPRDNREYDTYILHLGLLDDVLGQNEAYKRYFDHIQVTLQEHLQTSFWDLIGVYPIDSLVINVKI